MSAAESFMIKGSWFAGTRTLFLSAEELEEMLKLRDTAPHC